MTERFGERSPSPDEQKQEPAELPKEESGTAQKTEGEGMSRRKFLTMLGIGAGMAAAGELLKPKEGAAAETQPTTAFQVRDGNAVLVHFDQKGNVERYEVIASARDIGLLGKDTETMRSPEVTEAARKLSELGRRCRERGDVEACRSITLATVELSEAVRASRQPSPRGRKMR